MKKFSTESESAGKYIYLKYSTHHKLKTDSSPFWEIIHVSIEGRI